MTVALDIGIALLLLGLAAWTVGVRDTFSAVIGFMVYGLFVGLVWMRLAAVDVALTETAIGSGVTGMLLIGAAVRLRETEAKAVKPGLPLRLAAAAICVTVSAGLASLVLYPPQVAATLAPEAMAHMPGTGLGNPVTGVLFVYRAIDTLLEKVVVVLALVGVWSLAPDRLWNGIPGMRLYAQPDSVLVFLAQILPPVGIVIAIYMLWVGADDPGGAFQGGAVLAAMWLLVMIAGLRPVPSIGLLSLRLLVIAGPAIFLAIGFAGFWLAGAFLAYPEGYAKPLIILAEAALTLSIGVTLGLLAAGPPERISAP